MRKRVRQKNGRGSRHATLVRRVVQQIVQSVHPQKVVLFGSYAYGRPTRDSDVDFLVVMNSRKRPVERTIEVTKSLRSHPFPMDILVRTPREIRHRIRIGDPFFKEVMTHGKVLYSA